MHLDLFLGGAEGLSRFPDHCVQTDRLYLILSLHRIPEKLSRQVGSAPDQRLNHFEVAVVLVLRARIQEHQGYVPQDAHKQIIEIVRNPARQGSKGFHPQRLLELCAELGPFLFRLLQIRDIQRKADESQDLLIGAFIWDSVDQHPSFSPGSGDGFSLVQDRLSGSYHLQVPFIRFRVIFRKKIAVLPADKAVSRNTDCLCEAPVCSYESLVRILVENNCRGGVKHDLQFMGLLLHDLLQPLDIPRSLRHHAFQFGNHFEIVGGGDLVFFLGETKIVPEMLDLGLQSRNLFIEVQNG